MSVVLGSKKVAVIGSGAMGEALIAGLLAAKTIGAEAVFATDVSSERTNVLHERYGVKTGSDNRAAVTFADIVVLAVKPGLIDGVIADIRSVVTPATLILSIAAGVTLAQISHGLPSGAKIIRVMPNMPVLVREGMSVLAPGSAVDESDLNAAHDVFQSVGATLVLDEHLIDAVTGLSGSGPAYVLLLIEALADGGVRMGLPRDVALTLASHTARGAAQLQQITGDHPARLRDRITSPGGTTIAGLHVLEKGGFRGLVSTAVEMATKRATELKS